LVHVYGIATIEAINDGSARKLNGNYLHVWKKETMKIALNLVILAQ